MFCVVVNICRGPKGGVDGDSLMQSHIFKSLKSREFFQCLDKHLISQAPVKK
jgi:hypothetical protein